MSATPTETDATELPRAAQPRPLAATCIFAPGGSSGWTIELGPATVALGRDGRLAGDALASRRHAELLWSPAERRHALHDLGSSNGTFVNGERVTHAPVGAGDVIRIGHTVLAIAELADTAAVEPPFVGRSPALRAAVAHARAFATSPAPVLITGETGTGKELIADAVHRLSGRAGGLHAVNCAALPRELVESELFGHEKGAYSGAASARVGLFRAADGGTLFLDEVGELALDAQATLLRVLDTGTIRPIGASASIATDVRVVAATNRDLLREVTNHQFRADLYARLAEHVIAVAPLRQRLLDLEPLWAHYVTELGGGRTLELSGGAAEALALHAWPFNVRELRQLVRRVLGELPAGGLVAREMLPPELGKRAAPEAPAVEPGGMPTASELRRLVEHYEGNVRAVATFLGCDRKQVYRWLKRFDIEPKAYRNG